MCHFITLVAPTKDQAALDALMRSHGRIAYPTENASLASLLLPDEEQYFTASIHCDCGTVLGATSRGEDPEEKLAREYGRLKRKGWSAAKIDRALEGKRKASERPDRPGPDSYELWAAIVADLLDRLNLPCVGLFVHFYGGDQVEETFDATRREITAATPLEPLLERVKEDELAIFTRPARRRAG